MGFDLYGVKPKSQKGDYFRNNVWWWRPLWEFVIFTCNDILTKDDMSSGSFNDGRKINNTKAKRIGLRLQSLVKTGKVIEWAKERQKAIDALPDDKCDLCKGTGKRHDKVINGKCNGCNGKGTRRPWVTQYPFDVKNVTEFAEFCLESGGFSIC